MTSIRSDTIVINIADKLVITYCFNIFLNMYKESNSNNENHRIDGESIYTDELRDVKKNNKNYYLTK